MNAEEDYCMLDNYWKSSSFFSTFFLQLCRAELLKEKRLEIERKVSRDNSTVL